MISLSRKVIKDILIIDETIYDEYIDQMIPTTIAFVEEYCNNEFTVKDKFGQMVVDENENYTISEVGLVLPIAKIIEFYMNKSGVSQESISRVMYSYTNSLPASITKNLNSYRKVNFV